MTLNEHITLLGDKGYLTENFKTGVQIDYWINEFKEHFQHIKFQAVMEGSVMRFIIDMNGHFNNGLDKIAYVLRYQYDPDTDILNLASLHARMGKLTKTYYFRKSEDLVPAVDVYETLSKYSAQENHSSLYVRLWFEFQQQRNPDNDHKPDKPRYVPPKLGTPPKLKR